MAKEARCSNCVYWLHRTCTMTHEIKNDTICTCGQFIPREADD